MKYNSANMNTLIKSCLTLCLLWSAIGSHAQVIKKKRYRRLEKDKQPTQRPGSIAL